MKDDWFTAKTYGYGAAPKSWKGWAAILGFVAVQLAGAVHLMGTGGTVIEPWRIVAWVTATAALTVGFVMPSKAKTDGEWRWHWPEGKFFNDFSVL